MARKDEKDNETLNGIRDPETLAEEEELEDGEEEDDDLVVLEDEDGVETAFRFLAVVEVDDKKFALLTPDEDEDESDEEPTEIFIFRYEEDEDGGEAFSTVDDEQLFARVQAEAERLFALPEA